MADVRRTTVLLVRRDGQVALAADGQVSLGDTILKTSARKLRRLQDGRVLAGFAGSTADAFSLLSHFEKKLEEYGGNLKRASVELARAWRTDKMLRQLEALLIVTDQQDSFLISGQGDVIEPDDGLIGIGSGGAYALAAARALMRSTNLSATEIAEASLKIAGEICIYTNSHIIVETL
ncbi:MAG: ATP-dependent protease subunit HslV [Acidobacteriota bacterium]|nr:MAG: ATP-dependent protease subunit HslV [Acidobacteriota bacterium]